MRSNFLNVLFKIVLDLSVFVQMVPLPPRWTSSLSSHALPSMHCSPVTLWTSAPPQSRAGEAGRLHQAPLNRPTATRRRCSVGAPVEPTWPQRQPTTPHQKTPLQRAGPLERVVRCSDPLTTRFHPVIPPRPPQRDQTRLWPRQM